MSSSHFSCAFARHIAALLSLFAITVCLFAVDAPPEKRPIDVPASPVENAIKTLSLQTGVDILVLTKDVRGLRSKPVKGEYTTRAALEAMLAGMGLVIEQAESSRIITVRAANPTRDAKKKQPPRPDAPGENEPRPERAAAPPPPPEPPQTVAAPPQTVTTPPQTAAAPPQTVTVTGRVFNVATGYYVKNAEVRLDGTDNIVFTEDGGEYTITVPAGTVSLTASYASVQSATITLDAAPGGRNTADFDLKPLVFGGRPVPPVIVPTGTGAVGIAPIDREIVVLDTFVVAEERAGQAKAIQTQRAADNAVTAIATDNFGALTQGAVGEFLKYMPGVTIDYDEDEANAVRVGGLDPKYAGFAIDGIAIASANNSTSRANFFTQMSITGIESIEFNQTLLARMPANTPAGRFEMKSRYAFDRKKPELRYTLGLDGFGSAIELGRSYMPDDKKHYRTYPGGQISFGGPFLNRRLGIDISVSRYANYRNSQLQQNQYSYLIAPYADLTTGELVNPNPSTTFVTTRNGIPEMEAGPAITQLIWRDGPRIWTSSVANLSIDYRVTPKLTFSLRSQFTRTETEYFDITMRLTASEQNSWSDHYTGPPQGENPNSSLTRWIVNPSNPNSDNSFIIQTNNYRVDKHTNYLLSPRLEYKSGPLQINFRAARAFSRADYDDADAGTFRVANNRINGLGWEATRPDSGSPEWTLRRTAGTDWSVPDNWGRSALYFGLTYYTRSYVENIQDSAYLDLTLAMPVLGHPVTFRTGGGVLDSDYTFRRANNRLNFNGLDDYAIATVMPQSQNYIFNFDLNGKSGNINEQSWRVNNQRELWRIYQQRPEWFVEEETANFRREFLNARDLTERVEAAYVEATTRVGSLSLNAGLRLERTNIKVMTTRMRPWEDIIAAKEWAEANDPELAATGIFDFTTSAEGNRDMVTNEGFLYQYYDGQRFPRRTSYKNLFLSGGLKYDFTRTLRFQLSASQSILRPDFNNLAGNVQYTTYFNTSVWVPNPTLKPEKTTKFYAGLQWYLTPAGLLSLSAYRLDINGLQINNIQITAEQAEAQLGYPLRDAIIVGGEDGAGPTDIAAVYYRSTINAPGTRTIYGTTLEYNQQFTFLPGVLKGLSVFGSVTLSSLKNAELEEEKIGRANKSASGGIRYRYNRFNVELRATWQDEALVGITRPVTGRRWVQDDHIYRKARTIVDLSAGFRVSPRLELSLSIRNLTDSPAIFYSNVSDRLHRYQVFGSTWNLSLKGSF